MALTLEENFVTVEIYKSDELVHTHSNFPIIKIAEIFSNWSYVTPTTYKITKSNGTILTLTV